jgi:hypothetical protein
MDDFNSSISSNGSHKEIIPIKAQNQTPSSHSNSNISHTKLSSTRINATPTSSTSSTNISSSQLLKSNDLPVIQPQQQSVKSSSLSSSSSSSSSILHSPNSPSSSNNENLTQAINNTLKAGAQSVLYNGKFSFDLSDLNLI